MFQLVKDVLGIKSKEKKETIFNLPIKDIEDIMYDTENRHKLMIKVTPINAELYDLDDLDDVCEAIQAALNAYEGRYGIYIQSERVDISRNIKNIEEKKLELDEELKIMFLNEQKIHLETMTNKSRNVLNFYVVIETKEKNYMTAEQLLNDTFIAFKNELETCQMFCEQMKKNDIKQILYERLNPEQSSVVPYNQEFTLNDIMPQNVKKYKDGRHIEIENTINRFFAITSYPSTVDKYRWLRKIFNVKADINVAIILNPKNKATIQKELSSAIKESDAKKKQNEDNEYKRQEYERESESAKQMIDELGSDNVSLYDVNITIGVSAKDMKSLDAASNAVISKIASVHCLSTELKYKGFDPFFTTLPILVENKITKNYIWNLTSKDIASMIIFDSSEFMEDKGTLIGENVTSRGLVITNYYNKIYNNGHMTVIADSGSGKTFFLMTDAIRNIPYVDYTIMFDIKGDLQFPFGKRYTFTPKAGIISNPFHIRNAIIDSESDYEIGKNDVGTFLAQKIMDVVVFFKWIIPDMTPYDESLLEEDIRDSYKKCNIDFNSIDLPKEFPTMSTLEKVQQQKIKNSDTDMERDRRSYIKSCLKPYTSGAYSSMFNGQTNWEFDFFTVFDISNIPEAVKKPLYDILLKDTWQFAKKDGTKSPKQKRIYIDECHVFADPKNPQTLEFISVKLSKQSRGFGVYLITATQNLPDFLSIPRFGQAIIDNSYFKIFFRLGESDHDIAQKLYKFSSEEMKVLRASKNGRKGSKGKGIFIAGSQRVVIQTIASKFELEIIDPEQYEEIYGVPSRYIGVNKEVL